MTDLTPVLAILPELYRSELARMDTNRLEEVRLRAGRKAAALFAGEERPLGGGVVTPRLLNQIVSAASGHSCYAVEDKLRQGFLTLSGGHRLGLCGTAACQDGTVTALREISSVSIRIARQIHAAPEGILPWLDRSTLILGPPGAGKTTLLRDCVRLLSDGGRRVSLADERCEVAACVEGIPQLDVGACTDILSGCPKSQAMWMLLRTMNPQWMAADEITTPEDLAVMGQCGYCGVKLLATVHAASREELTRRPLYRRLLEEGLFGKLLILDGQKQVRLERMDG